MDEESSEEATPAPAAGKPQPQSQSQADTAPRAWVSLTLADVTKACKTDMRNTTRCEIMGQQTCTTCIYLGLAEMDAFESSLSRNDIINAYFAFVEKRHIPVPVDAPEVGSTEIMNCVRTHLIPNTILSDGSNSKGSRRGGRSLKMDTDNTKQFRMMYSAAEFESYKKARNAAQSHDHVQAQVQV